MDGASAPRQPARPEMRTPAARLSPQARLAIAAALTWGLLAWGGRLLRMDPRFFPPSLDGLRGLTLYLVGDLRGAARAYRFHHEARIRAGRSTGDPGYDALLEGDVASAERISRATLERETTALGPRLTLAAVALERGRPDEVLAQCDEILRRDPDQFDAFLLSAVAATRSGDADRARRLLNRALRTSRAESRISSFLSALELTGELAGSRKAGEQPCLLAHFFRYLRIFDPAQRHRAIAYAKRAIASRDHADDAYLTLGILFVKENRRGEALRAFRQAIALNPSNAEAFRWAFVIYSWRADLANADRMARAAMEAAPDDPFYARQLLEFLTTQLGDYQQALTVAQGILAAHPSDAKMLEWVAYLNQELGDHERALAGYRKAIDINPEDASLYEHVGFNLGRLNRAPEAMEAYRAALAIHPEDVQALAALGRLYYDAGRHEEAIQALEAAFRAGDDDVYDLALLGALYHEVGAFERAVACLRRVLVLDPHNTLAQHLLPYTLRNITREETK